MEKFRIAMYGCAQVVALMYGILGTSLLAKAIGTMSNHGGYTPSGLQEAAKIYHDYGIFLSVIILGWAAWCGYHTSSFSNKPIGEATIVTTGLIMTGIFFVFSTFLIAMSISLFLMTPP